MFKDWKKDILTIPNLLSLFRIILIPVYIIIYLKATDLSDYILAATILAVSCLTDLIDGKIARHFNMISNLGKILDPFADKATQFTLIVCLLIKSAKHSVLWLLVILFVVKESFQLIAGSLVMRKGMMLKGAQLTGKVSTTVLFCSLILFVMMPDLNEMVIKVIALIDAVFMVIALVDYMIVYMKKQSKFQSLDEPA